MSKLVPMIAAGLLHCCMCSENTAKLWRNHYRSIPFSVSG
jgi:hypothetical protein